MRTLLISTLITLSMVSFGQSSYQIVDTSKTWNTIRIGYIPGALQRAEGQTPTRFRDISIPGDQYLDVIESDDSLQQEWDYKGVIREDTLNKQVYYNRFGETEGLIYDFSLDVGDTVFVDNQYLNYNEVVRLVVDSIDVADIYGVMRNRFFFPGWIFQSKTRIILMKSGLRA
ncbi:MAG: hypothetical protein IPN08_18845 [Bacteroidales bacterium]|nr:hypothetical protein [Bacteroidales bacterium]